MLERVVERLVEVGLALALREVGDGEGDLLAVCGEALERLHAVVEGDDLDAVFGAERVYEAEG